MVLAVPESHYDKILVKDGAITLVTALKSLTLHPFRSKSAKIQNPKSAKKDNAKVTTHSVPMEENALP